MIEQTEPDPYSIALRRLEKVFADISTSVGIAYFGNEWLAEVIRYDKPPIRFFRSRLPDAINAACDAVEGV